MTALRRLRLQEFRDGAPSPLETDVIAETAVSLNVNGLPWFAFLCSPLDLESLAVGFLFNEGVVSAPGEVVSVSVCARKENVDVCLDRAVPPPSSWQRTSGCGGGVTTTGTAGEEGPGPAHPSGSSGPFTPTEIGALAEELLARQELYGASGGVHMSALSDGERFVAAAEDIGRHNTLDKVAGRCLLDRVTGPRRAIVTTGRVSSEMIQKARRIGVPLVVSRTSPTARSVDLAERWGMTLVGYARKDRFVAYAHAERIVPNGGG
jgi:FdhD protein